MAPHAYSIMIAKLRETSSQFVVGSSDRLLGRSRSSVKMMDKLHAGTKHSIQLGDAPEILSDVFLWNKMFRRDFWDSAVGTIPENVLYEDQETTARAYVRATAFDVIQDTVYHWRIRSDGSSITQNKNSIRDLADRLRVVDSVSALLMSEAGSDVLLAWFTRVLGSDLVPYYEVVPHAGPDYWDALHSGLARIISSMQCLDSEFLATVLKNIGPHEQTLCTLAAQGARGDFESVLCYRTENGTGFEVQIRDNTFFARLDYLDALTTSHPQRMLEIHSAALMPASHVRCDGWSNDGSLLLSGHLYVLGLDSEAFPGDLSVRVTGPTRDLPGIEVSRVQDPHLDMLGNDAYASHAAAGFTCRVCLDHVGETTPGSIEVVVTLAIAHEVVERRHVLNLPPRSLDHNPADRTLRQPIVTDITFDAEREEFSVGVRVPRTLVKDLATFDVALATARNTVRPTSAITTGQDGRRFTFALKQTVWGRQAAAPLSGTYTLRYGTGLKLPDQLSKPVMTMWGLSAILPLEHGFQHAVVSAVQAPSGALAVRIMPPLQPEERGTYNQRRLRDEYAGKAAYRALTDAVLFESFAGKSCTDSPRALSDALHARSPAVPIFWSISDFSVEYPDYAVPVLRGSREWFTRLKTSGTVVNNNSFPAYFQKSEGQRYVQTWHGTPLKKLARHAPTRYLSASYRRRMEREALMWDVMIAQNGFAADVLADAFGYGGDVLTLGYPRNDTLATEDRVSRAQQIRRDLGISPNKIVVLYAPTWRDNVKDASRRHALVAHLDFGRARESLGSEHVFLLRGHHNVAGGSATRVGANLIDVSMYPEVNDLILASDLLVTDYSSIAFDYCVTDKPMYFLVPDLSEYRDEIRGFYLNWEAEAPGPLCVDTDELCDAIRSASGSRAKTYGHFKSTYAALDDGAAALRVTEAIWPAEQVSR
ncbi:hypothetical protein AR539_00325 [Arthrobacter sp. EPSL27]|nr:hypothetical protein AR539_00325 [Arthrobacter sp. EPSL27]